MVAPAKTPSDVIAVLEKALIKALAEKPLQNKFLATGAELVPEPLQTAKGFGDYIKKEYENTKQAALSAGLKPE